MCKRWRCECADVEVKNEGEGEGRSNASWFPSSQGKLAFQGLGLGIRYDIHWNRLSTCRFVQPQTRCLTSGSLMFPMY